MLQIVQDLLEYRKAKTRLADCLEDFDRLFPRFRHACSGGRCLRMLFDPDREPDLGPGWATLDLATIEVTAREGERVVIDLDDEYFDAVLFTGMEQLSHPASFIKEARRILKQNGQIWVETALCAPYAAPRAKVRPDYWRFTPEGLRVLLDPFDEIVSSVYSPAGSALRQVSFFYGLKPAIDPDNS